MDNQRLFLYLGLGFLLLLIWQTWQMDYVYGPQLAAQEAAAPRAGEGKAASAADGALPAVTPAGQSTAVEDSAPPASSLQVETEVLALQLSSRGADVAVVDLLDYPVALDRLEQLVRMVGATDERYMAIQTGLQASAGAPAPTHQSEYRFAADQPALDGADRVVSAQWSEGGIEVTKRWIFPAGRYDYRVEFQVENRSGAPWTGWQYRQLQRSAIAESEKSTMTATYTGGVVSTPQAIYTKVSLDDIAESALKETAEGGWVAMIQHYFANAVVPGQDERNTVYTRYRADRDRYILGMVSDAVTLQPGEQHTFSTRFFVGPKIQDQLEALAPNLRLTVDYGYLTFLAQPLFWLMSKIHAVVGNWGWTIILLTVVVKGAFYKLSEMSYKSMARMKKLQPQMQALKERHGDDREAMGRATMELYKKEKVNPLGGCLPMLVQIPVFIALYWTLMESVELRQAPWIAWIRDLSEMDPYFVLPVLMGISMFVQQKLNPAPVDPIQQKVFLAMPFIFTVFFAFFASGLVLYWITNNVLSIAQQYYITRHVIGDDKPVTA